METSAKTILVIDDDMGVQMFVTQVLKNMGFQVLAAADMQEALHMSDACPTEICLILTDIMLPTSNGMALAQALLAKRPSTRTLECRVQVRRRSTRFNSKVRRSGNSSRSPSRLQALAKKVQAMVLDKVGGPGSLPEAEPPALFAGADALRQSSDAVYRLESAVRCAQCGETVFSLRYRRCAFCGRRSTSLPPFRDVAACSSARAVPRSCRLS